MEAVKRDDFSGERVFGEYSERDDKGMRGRRLDSLPMRHPER